MQWIITALLLSILFPLPFPPHLCLLAQWPQGFPTPFPKITPNPFPAHQCLVFCLLQLSSHLYCFSPQIISVLSKATLTLTFPVLSLLPHCSNNCSQSPDLSLWGPASKMAAAEGPWLEVQAGFSSLCREEVKITNACHRKHFPLALSPMKNCFTCGNCPNIYWKKIFFKIPLKKYCHSLKDTLQIRHNCNEIQKPKLMWDQINIEAGRILSQEQGS